MIKKIVFICFIGLLSLNCYASKNADNDTIDVKTIQNVTPEKPNFVEVTALMFDYSEKDYKYYTCIISLDKICYLSTKNTNDKKIVTWDNKKK